MCSYFSLVSLDSLGLWLSKNQLRGPPPAQELMNPLMGWTAGQVRNGSSASHQLSSFSPSLCSPYKGGSVHSQVGFSQGGRWLCKFLGSLLHIPVARSKETSLLVTLKKDGESVFSRNPSPANQPWHFIGLNWAMCLFLSQSQWPGKCPLLIGGDGSFFFPSDWPVLLLRGVCQLSPKHQDGGGGGGGVAGGRGKRRATNKWSSGYCSGRKMGPGRVAADIHYIVSSVAILLIWVKCWG